VIRRREFIAGLGGAAVWPLPADAQQAARKRRIGVLMNLAADDPQSLSRIAAFHQGLQELGWTIGLNMQIEYRWNPGGSADLYRRYAEELVAMAPDALLASAASAYPLQQATRSVPIVFANVVDPVGAGLVASLARPGGNVTGFMTAEYGMSGKWLGLLKQIAPHVARAAILRDPTNPVSIGQLAAIQAVAPSFGVELSPLNVRAAAADIERAVSTFAQTSNGGLIVVVGSQGAVHRELIVTLAARHRLPAVYPYRYFVTSGGLISYGPDEIDQYRRAAGYVDRILKGEKPGDLPVQAPTKFETVLNPKTAKALGLTIPETLLATADEVIQ
jgi:putative tryptophan/tyrosine transport system substrate-binding protein